MKFAQKCKVPKEYSRENNEPRSFDILDYRSIMYHKQLIQFVIYLFRFELVISNRQIYVSILNFT